MGAKPLQLDTSLSEFTYTVARETPVSLRRHLPEKYFRAINTEKGAMRFAARSTWEQKRELFAYLGIEMFTIFMDTKGGAVNDFRDIFKDFDTDENPGKAMRKFVDQNVFITSNRELCYQLGLIAQTIDTKGYARSMELLRTSYHVKNFKNKISIPEHAEAVDEKDLSDFFIKVLSSTLWTTDICETFLGIKSDALRLLLYFFTNRQTYVQKNILNNTFVGGLSMREMSAARKTLLSNGLIQRHPKQDNNSWTITSKGILIVNQFRDKVIKSMDF